MKELFEKSEMRQPSMNLIKDVLRFLGEPKGPTRGRNPLKPNIVEGNVKRRGLKCFHVKRDRENKRCWWKVVHNKMGETSPATSYRFSYS